MKLENLEIHELIHSVLQPILEEHSQAEMDAVDYQAPEELLQRLAIHLPEDAAQDGQQTMSTLLQQVLAFTPHSQHPGALGYLYSDPDPVGVLGDCLVSALNTNVHTFEASPVFSIIETVMIQALTKQVGFGPQADGIFAPGGSYSNMMALHLARKRLTERGQPGQPVVFTSEQAHYSFQKSGELLGIGLQNVIRIPCDSAGKMRVDLLAEELERAVQSGARPMCICATSGTTVLGGFDPLPEISALAKEHGDIWLHVDAAWGGAVLMSAKHRHLMNGAELADSVTWDFHKALNAPILCSSLLVRDGDCLSSMFQVEDDYLFHGAPNGPQWDLGKKTAQCGRRADAFKLYLMWQVRGRSHFEQRVNRSFEVAKEVLAMLSRRDCFWLRDRSPDYWNICFHYVPEHLRHRGSIDNCTDAEKEELGALTEALYKCMCKDGRIIVNWAKLPGEPAFLRLIVAHPSLQPQALDRSLDIIESLGDMLAASTEELLISGGDERLDLGENGLNYTLIAPAPLPGQVSRASCTSSRITIEDRDDINELLGRFKAGAQSFRDGMDSVHDRIRSILEIDDTFSIVTCPSGTDSEYIPLMIARAAAGRNTNVVNIITGAGEVGASSAIAAKGLFFKSSTPSGSSVKPTGTLEGMHNVDVIEVSMRNVETGAPSAQTDVWVSHVTESASRPDTLVLLHILESSKLGYRLDEMETIASLRAKYPDNLLIVVDACQSRTDINRIRLYLVLGCMVMVTGSKFEQGPPFSGAVVVPPQVTEQLSPDDFDHFPEDLKNFISAHDVSGPLGVIRDKLPLWMNWGGMLRWTLGLGNWERYRAIEDDSRNDLVAQWVERVLEMVHRRDELEVFAGGGQQPGAVGNTNTIISIKLLRDSEPMGQDALRCIYRWMAEDMSALPGPWAPQEPAVLDIVKRSFLLGQPVNVGAFAVLRIALGARLAVRIHRDGIEGELANDAALLDKLTWLVRHYDEIRAAEDADGLE